ncbi:PREDICTED: uncharacterized protein LOC108377467, partial [Rhagoletis zephyria]|uniref:uncharacterized protein LOC108377467 n=1 Tax=Rhagoletis zephyria TaxID=28612 RepID=UPI0008119D6B
GKDRSISNVRDRIYDDPAYTDDISHLANPLRRNSCSGKPDSKVKSLAGGSATGNAVVTGGSSSLGKRSKLTKEFLQQGKLRDGGGSYERNDSSSSDEPLRSASQSKSATGSVGRRGRSLERSSAAHGEGKSAEKKREKRERSSKQKGNACMEGTSLQQQPNKQQMEGICAASASNRRSKAQSAMMTKQYSDGAAADLQWAGEQARDELASVRSGASTSKAIATGVPTPTASSSGGSSKMQIGRRFLRGEIGIKSFNYYLLKEGIKSSKRFVEKQRNSISSGLASAAGGGKKSHSRSEENIYEEIFFKDAPPSDDEQQESQQHQQVQSECKAQATIQQQNHHHQQQQQHEQHTKPQQSLPQSVRGADTPISQCSGSEEGLYADCELCLQQCTKENCEYCYAQQSRVAADSQDCQGKVQRDMAKPYAVVPLQHQQPQQDKNLQQQFDSLGHPLITQAPCGNMHTSDDCNEAMSGNGNAPGNRLVGGQLPTAHILEFQSYNPNNPGVYKIETTPVAITGEYNPILQFQQSSPSTGTATTTTPSAELQPQPQLNLAHHVAHMPQQQTQLPQQFSYQQAQPQQQQQQQQFKHSSQSYILQSGATLPHHHCHQSGVGGVSTSSAGILITQQRVRGSHRSGSQQSHYMLAYNTPTMAAGPPPTGVGMQRMNTKSSSSSDSLQHQHMHKYNTMSRLEAQQVLLGDPFYGGANVGPTHSLMFAASRPIGGSQILVDPYDLPQMYKSDSRASIISEYSLRSSDNSHRYNRFRYAGGGGGSFSGVAGGGGGGGQVSDSSLGDSLFSCTSAQRRYFGSSESCRFGFECRRCSLDGGEKCSYSDTCRYECRNCDCSSSYFSSDFDELYGSVAGAGSTAAALAAQRSSGIPRKTAAGTLPANAGHSEYDRQQEQLNLKQNKYAQDFFKHVNDVKRSIYQSEMQRNGSGSNEDKFESSRSKSERGNEVPQAAAGSPRRHATKEAPQITTLPLTKERSRAQRASNVITSNTDSSATPTPAPRPSLQQAQLTAQPKVIQRSRHAQVQAAYERHSEYPSLDRLVASATGAIPKASTAALPASAVAKSKNNPTNTMQHSVETGHDINSNSASRTERYSPRHSPKSLKITDRPLGLPVASMAGVHADAAKASCRETRVAAEAITNNNNNNLAPSAADANHNKPTEMHGAAKKSAVGGAGGSTKREARYLSVEQSGNAPVSQSAKRHHRSTSAAKQSAVPLVRRSKDIPAPPPPSPATYSDLQELKVNLENAQQQGDGSEGDAKKSSAERKKKKRTKEDNERQAKINATEGRTQMEKDEQRQLALKEAKEMQTAELSPTRSDSAIGHTEVKKSRKARRSASAIEEDTNTAATPNGGKDLCETPTPLLAVKKTSPTGAVVVAGANCMPVASSVMQQEPQKQQRAHTKSSNANSSSKNASDAVKQLEVCNSAHATDDDDVFYDARSEDSGGTAHSAASSNLLRQQATATVKSRNERCSLLRDV